MRSYSSLLPYWKNALEKRANQCLRCETKHFKSRGRQMTQFSLSWPGNNCSLEDLTKEQRSDTKTSSATCDDQALLLLTLTRAFSNKDVEATITIRLCRCGMRGASGGNLSNDAYAKKAKVLPVEEESKEVCIKLLLLPKGPCVNMGADLRYDTEVHGLSTWKLADLSDNRFILQASVLHNYNLPKGKSSPPSMPIFDVVHSNWTTRHHLDT